MNRVGWAIAALGLLNGCDAAEPGYLWRLDVRDPVDECHNPAVDYSGPLSFDYRLVYDEATVTLFLDKDPFATGTIGACSVAYESVVWSEEHDGFAISWKLTGNAQYRPGGSSCELDPGVDWEGTETFEIVQSEDPDLEVGCTYQIGLWGNYTGAVE